MEIAKNRRFSQSGAQNLPSECRSPSSILNPTHIETDRVFFLATLKLVEIVGEAATRISEPLQAAHPEIPWREIIGTRNHLIHGYDAVDYSILWDIVTGDFAPLARQIKALLPDQP